MARPGSHGGCNPGILVGSFARTLTEIDELRQELITAGRTYYAFCRSYGKPRVGEPVTFKQGFVEIKFARLFCPRTVSLRLAAKN